MELQLSSFWFCKPSYIHNPKSQNYQEKTIQTPPKLQIHDYFVSNKQPLYLQKHLIWWHFHHFRLHTWNPAASKRSFAWCSSCAWPLCGGFMAPVVNTTWGWLGFMTSEGWGKMGCCLANKQKWVEKNLCIIYVSCIFIYLSKKSDITTILLESKIYTPKDTGRAVLCCMQRILQAMHGPQWCGIHGFPRVKRVKWVKIWMWGCSFRWRCYEIFVGGIYGLCVFFLVMKWIPMNWKWFSWVTWDLHIYGFSGWLLWIWNLRMSCDTVDGRNPANHLGRIKPCK